MSHRRCGEVVDRAQGLLCAELALPGRQRCVRHTGREESPAPRGIFFHVLSDGEGGWRLSPYGVIC
jgi:hypothetical protein